MMIARLTSAEVLGVLRFRGLDAASVEFVADPWDHVVEWIAHNEQRVAIAQGTATIKCRRTPQSIEVYYEVSAAEPL